MELTVGIVLCFDGHDRGAPLRSRSAMSFLALLEERHPLRIFAVDWRSITQEGLAVAVDVRNRCVSTQPLARMDLLHFCEIGVDPDRRETLREKWRGLSDRLSIIERIGVRCVNPARTLREASNKRYLEVLARRGVQVIPTEILPARTNLEELRARMQGQGRQIVKPANGECSRYVFPLETLTQQQLDEITLHADELLVQPYVEEIRQGERSIFLLGRRVSHAALKLPAPDDFRANSVHTGAKIISYAPTRDEIAFAFDALDAFPYAVDMCRVDFLVTRDGPRLMELEVIDPAAYVARDAAFAERMSAFYSELIRAPAASR